VGDWERGQRAVHPASHVLKGLGEGKGETEGVEGGGRAQVDGALSMHLVDSDAVKIQ